MRLDADGAVVASSLIEILAGTLDEKGRATPGTVRNCGRTIQSCTVRRSMPV